MISDPAIRPALAGLAVLWAVALPAAEKPAVLTALSTELARSMEVLGELPEPPYFLSYEVTEQDAAAASASFGTLTYSYQRRNRFLDVDLRVGDYELDNTRPIRSAQRRARRSYTRIPVEDDVDAIKSVVWNQTDISYKQALQQLTKVRTDVEVKVDAEDQSADFSREEAQRNAAQPAALTADLADWEAKVRRYTAPFAAYGDIYRANAGLSATAETRWFVNSEGAEIQTSETRYRLSIRAQTKADDGMTLPRYESFSAFSIDGLPDDDSVLATVDRMIADLRALRDAPVVDPYTGPAILSGRASGVFFHEILGHRVEGHRQKRVDDGQTFKKKIDEQILPAGFTVSFDPTRRAIVDTDLVGSYEYDNQGVRAQRVDVVQDGVFKRFLMSRTPIEGFSNSNGHGRKQTGYQPVSRQSNLIVEVAEPLTREALKEALDGHAEGAGQAVRLAVRRHPGRRYHHRAVHAQRLQCPADPRLPHLPGRSRGARSGRGPDRHAAHHVEPRHRSRRPTRRVQRHLRCRVRRRARLRGVAGYPGVTDRGAEEEQVARAHADPAAAVRRR